MSKNIPFLTYSFPRPSNNNCGCIVADGQITYPINDMCEFYEAVGYTHEMQKQGVLPEEFIWEEYAKDSSPYLSACFQKHLIVFMLNNSPSFKEKYGVNCASWIVEHANERVVSRSFCNKCRLQLYCPSVTI